MPHACPHRDCRNTANRLCGNSPYNANDVLAFESLEMPQLVSRLLLSALICLLSLLAFGQAQSSDAVAEGFVRAWNEHDMVTWKHSDSLRMQIGLRRPAFM